jgi:selenocysteine lyase/cysteine desulfurase
MPEPDFAAFRRRFPILGRRVYVNSCSQGALSIEVDEALSAFRDSWDRDGSPWDRWVGEVEAARAAFAGFINAGTDEVAIVPSASVGVSTLASALDFTGPRRTVVLGEFEFPTMGQIWLAQQARGASLRWVRAAGHELDAAAYAAAIDEDTLIVPVTHVCFRNGFRLDVPRIAAACRARGAYVLLDDYQHTGTGPLDVHALGVDFLVTGALKYMLGPSGVAFLYVRRALLERFTPSVTGWFGRVDPFAFSVDRLDWSPTARRFEGGTPAVPSACGARAGLDLLATMPAALVAARVADLVGRFFDGATAAGFASFTSADPSRRGPLVVLESRDAPALVQRLQARGIVCSARGRGLRVSFHAYNDESDVDAVLDALGAEAPLLERAAAPANS